MIRLQMLGIRPTVSTVTDILNEVLALEQCSLCARLMESTVFVSTAALEELSIVKRMAQTDAQHTASLVDAILQRGGSPGPRVGDIRSADLHFQDLHYVLPRLVEDRKRLVQKCTLAAQRIAADADASGLIASIAAHHQEELDTLGVLSG